jgi:glycosyltransferase involved in cell wall biosynthesis
VRILSDIFPLQIQPSRHRGIGQYTRGALNGLLRHPDRNMSHIFFGNGHLPQPDPFPPDAPANWRLYYGDFPLEGYGPEQWLDQLGAYATYWQAWIDRFAPQVLHIHSPFEWGAPLHSRYVGTPMVLTVYDVIPLRFEEHYLRQGPPWMKKWYRYVSGLVRQVDHVITISEHARRDVIDLLGVNPECTSAAPSGPSGLINCTPGPHVMADLRRKFGIPGGFVISISGIDYRKNMPRTLQSYSRLEPRLRKEFPLVIVCKLLPEEENHLRGQAADLGIADQVVLTNYVSDDELAALYRMAAVEFFPSLYEGFGMPVLDAMLCGVPVVTSNVSSLPEVAGDAALLVDPLNVDEMADALTRVLEDETLRAEMRAKGLAQASAFSWEKAANVFHQVYETVGKPDGWAYAAPLLQRSPSQLHSLALVSPLPPQRSGVADFSVDLLQALREHLPVTAFVQPDLLSAIRQRVNGPVESIVELPRLVHAGEIDGVLYQVGNSVFHHFLLPYLMAVPGVVELHDGILHLMIQSLTFSAGDKAGYRQELSYAHDRLGLEHADDVINGWEPPALYQMAVNRRVVNHAVGVIVHNRWTAEAVKSHGTNLPVEIIHHPVPQAERAEKLDRQQARLNLGIPQDALVLATFGRLAPPKRLEVILRVWAQLRQEFSNARLFLVGELDPASDRFNIPKLMKDLGIVEHVHVTGYIERSRFVEYMAATDIALNLRYPHAGETSGTLVRLLNAGIPTITSNVGAFAEVPDDCCWKVDVDETEEMLLLAYLRRLAADQALRKQMSANAVHFVKTQIPDWERSVSMYLDFIQKSLLSQASLLPRVQEPDDLLTSMTFPSLTRAKKAIAVSRWERMKRFFHWRG